MPGLQLHAQQHQVFSICSVQVRCVCSVPISDADAYLGLLQPPRQLHDAIIVESAKSIMSAAAQSIQLTELSSQRDMSTLLAQSAVQVGLHKLFFSLPDASC